MTCSDCIRELSGRFKLLNSATCNCDRDKTELEFVLMQTCLNDRATTFQCGRCLSSLGYILPIAWAALQDGNQDALAEHIAGMNYEIDTIIEQHGEAVNGS